MDFPNTLDLVPCDLQDDHPPKPFQPLTLGLSNIATGPHDIEVFDGVGRLLVHTAITAGLRASFEISTPLSPGVYWTRINGRPAGAIFSVR
jgi:hypothetical protein